ncbi:hypothetical protein SAY86_004078 [Trapa natans]|uniref:Cation efflux protein cytoplasmic domain-containing protein n=1 Tax=Trapa natans TaxID=22666 RepID=A0AAN7N310_TRANT|nr:hypothetical protein SAY86_004078 [Trapa natans]
MAVIASTLDSFLDLLSGFILWFTANDMRKPNHYHYPIGKRRMQPVSPPGHGPREGEVDDRNHGVGDGGEVHPHGILPEIQERDGQRLRTGPLLPRDHQLCRLSHRRPGHPLLLVDRPHGRHRDSTVHHRHMGEDGDRERVAADRADGSAGVHREADLPHVEPPPGDPAHRHVRVYTFGSHYFVEVDIVLPQDMLLNHAHNIGEALQEKLEQLPEVERAFVHIDFEFTHRPEHNNQETPLRDGECSEIAETEIVLPGDMSLRRRRSCWLRLRETQTGLMNKMINCKKIRQLIMLKAQAKPYLNNTGKNETNGCGIPSKLYDHYRRDQTITSIHKIICSPT